MKNILLIIRTTFSEWSQDQAPRLAAALSYYTIFSLGPFLVVIITLAGLIFGAAAVQSQVLNQISTVIGPEAANFIKSMIAGASQQRTGIISTVIGLLTLLFGALGVFGELQNTLNTIWNVKPRPVQGVWANIEMLLMRRLLSFSMVLVIGFLLIVSLVLTAAISAFSSFLASSQPNLSGLLWWGNNIILFLMVGILFALTFRVMPDARTAWRDVFIGGFVTSLLFSLGRYAIGLYLGQSRTGSSFGAAGALVLILMWIYYSAQIVFLGAEFTQVFAKIAGKGIRPERHAIWIDDHKKIEKDTPAEKHALPHFEEEQAPAGRRPS